MVSSREALEEEATQRARLGDGIYDVAVLFTMYAVELSKWRTLRWEH